MPTEKQRRDAERRRLQRQAQRRVERARRRRLFSVVASIVGTLIVIAIVLVFVVATSNDDKKPAAAKKTSQLPTPTASASTSAAAASYPCTWTAGGTATKKVTAPSTTTPPKSGKVTVSVATNRGALRFTLNRALAPCTVASFVSLAQQHFYDKSPCHRLTTTGIYVLQCGDPTGAGAGGPGYTVPDEATGNENYPAGTIAMARSAQAHSGGSQFFIVYKNSPNLRQNLGTLQYTVFGTVSSGLAVIDKVAAKGATPTGDGKPKLPITLTKLTVRT